MGKINVIDLEGTKHELDAVEGWRVMQIIREHGLPVEGICDGICECATCHVFVDESWQAKLHEPKYEEQDLLDTLPNVEDNSRLSCQLLYDEHLDGLTLTLANED